MPPVVAPDNPESTHHLLLTSKAGETFGLILVDGSGRPHPRGIQMSSYGGTSVVVKPPSGRFDSRVRPFVGVVQSEFGGGSGQIEFERNRTKFYDSSNLWTLDDGRVYPAPLLHLSKGYRNLDGQWPGSVKFYELLGDRRHLATKFTAGASYTASRLYLILRRKGTPGTLNVHLYSDSAGTPNVSLESKTISAADLDETLSVIFTVTGYATALVSSTAYHVVLVADANDDINNRWEIATGTSFTGHSSPNGSTWTATTFGLYSIFTGPGPAARRWAFRYQGNLYQLAQLDSGVAPNLYENGHHGRALGTHDANTLQDTSAAFTASALIGATLTVRRPSTGQVQIREISANGVTTIDVIPDFDWTPANADYYTVKGLQTEPQWKEVTGHGLTRVYSPPLVVGQIIYFPQGKGTPLHRARWDISGGLGWQFAADGTNEADGMIEGAGPDGTANVWAWRNSDASSNTSVSRSLKKAWGTNLVLTEGRSPMVVGGGTGQDWPTQILLNMFEYDRLIWVWTPRDLYAIDSDLPKKIVSFKSFSSDKSGFAVAEQTPYMYFSLGGSLEQLFGRDLTDVGVGRGKHLPNTRRGFVSSLATTAKHIFKTINAGRNGYSAVFATENPDLTPNWHEVFRCPLGEQALELFVEEIDLQSARLWVFTDRLVGYMLVGQNTTQPEQDNDVDYTWEGHLVTSWYADDLLDVSKFWAHLRLFTEGLDPGIVEIEVDYQIDDDTDDDDWRPFITLYDKSPSQSEWIGTRETDGKRVRFRIRLYTQNKALKAVLVALLADYIGKFPSARSYTVRFVLQADGDLPMENLSPEEDEWTSDDLYDFLRRVENDPVPLYLRSTLHEFDNIRVSVELGSLSVVEAEPGEDKELFGVMRLIEATEVGGHED